MSKICEFENCEEEAYYARFYMKPERCKTHKEDRKLQYTICVCGKGRPSFNYHEEKAKYCSKCKKEDMINVVSKKCYCGKAQPTFNYKGKPAKYCKDCKKVGMMDVKSKRCICGKIPIYNYDGMPPAYCKKCKKEEMIDVKNKKCHCEKAQPNYNYEGKPAKYCKECKTEGMIDVKHQKCHCGKARPTFNYEGELALFCNDCKKEDMIDVVNKRCLGQDGNCPQHANPKYRGHCAFCFAHTFPNDPLTSQIHQKTKEIAVRDFINSKFEGFSHDKALYTGGCDCTHRRRIDHRKLIGNTLLAIETDENQHKRYNEYDEEIRYDDLYMVHSGKWIFIRFNPDPYTDKDGEKRNPRMKIRLHKLEEEINKQINRIEKEKNSDLVEITKLYYDQ